MIERMYLEWGCGELEGSNKFSSYITGSSYLGNTAFTFWELEGLCIGKDRLVFIFPTNDLREEKDKSDVFGIHMELRAIVTNKIFSKGPFGRLSIGDKEAAQSCLTFLGIKRPQIILR